MPNAIDLRLHKYGRLTVKKYLYTNKSRNRIWLCICDCGEKINVLGSSLRSGNTKSCGCLFKENLIKRNTTHAMSNSYLHKIWQSMIQRCTYKKDKRYKNYGGRGINVCKRWLKFENFFEDMGHRTSKNHSLDRINNNKGYYKSNCRWATPLEQANNKSNNIIIYIDKIPFTVPQLSRKFNISYDAIRKRILKGKNGRELIKPINR